jgi:plastocyanin
MNMKGTALTCVSILMVFFFLYPPNTGLAGIQCRYTSKVKSLSSEIDGYTTEHADTTVVEIKSEGIELSYSVTEIRAKAGDILLIRYFNESDMNHNIVLVREEADIRPVGIAALQAVASDWIPEKEMERIIAYSELAYPGDSVELSFQVPPPGTYPYICTYSAHWTQMQGRLISTE